MRFFLAYACVGKRVCRYVSVGLCEVTLELNTSLIGYLMKCSYEITDERLEVLERSGTGGEGGFGCACNEWGSMM